MTMRLKPLAVTVVTATTLIVGAKVFLKKKVK